VPHWKNYNEPMPPMGGAQLTRSEIAAVASYVWAISHRNDQQGSVNVKQTAQKE
jgi:mono/diheme cytochrome c family protein